ncbi:hypothetical protein FGB62_387g09 [Gracilaria domingensis]|nr:hypothetical protein FGB62_387g09 [Gracilaria domingensis]
MLNSRRLKSLAERIRSRRKHETPQQSPSAEHGRALEKSGIQSQRQTKSGEKRSSTSTSISRSTEKPHTQVDMSRDLPAPPELSSHSITSLISVSPGERVVALTEAMKRSEWYIGIEKQPLPHPANYATTHADIVIDPSSMQLRCSSVLAMGLCTPVDVHDDRRVSQLAMEIENNTHVPSVDFEDIVKGTVLGIAISYKHGRSCSLSRTRLVEGLHALRAFVDAGDKASIWVDSVFRRSEKSALQLNPDISEKSWMSHGLLPYHLFPVLCLGNSSSERNDREWVESFWLNLEGIMGCLGSGFIFCNHDILDAPIRSWHVGDGDEPLHIVRNDSERLIALKRGSLMSTTFALTHILKVAVEGGFRDKVVTFQEDLFKLEEMAGHMMLIGNWKEFGDVIFRAKREILNRHEFGANGQTPVDDVVTAVKRTSFSFKMAPGDQDTLNEVLVSTTISKWKGVLEWTPTQMGYFECDNAELLEVWVHLYSKAGDAAIGVCFSVDPGENEWPPFCLKYMKVLVLQLNRGKEDGRRKVACKKLVWNKFVPGVLRCIAEGAQEASGDGLQLGKWVNGMVQFVRMAGVPVGSDVMVSFHHESRNNWD